MILRVLLLKIGGKFKFKLLPLADTSVLSEAIA